MLVQSDSKPHVLYTSHVHVTPAPGAIKLVHLPQEKEAVAMGVHGAIAAHYKMREGDFTPRAATLDYLVGATTGCLMGTLNRALLMRNISTANGRLQVAGVGEVEAEDGVLVVKRIRVIATLSASESDRSSAELALRNYADKCPMYRTLRNAIEITTELDFRPINSEAL